LNIDDYLDKALSMDEAEAFEAHLDACGKCRKDVALVRLLRDACLSLGDEGVAIPADLHASIMAPIFEEMRNEQAVDVGSDAALVYKNESSDGSPNEPIDAQPEAASNKILDFFSRRSAGRKSGDANFNLLRQARVAAVLLICIAVGFAASLLIQNFNEQAIRNDIAANETTAAATTSAPASATIVAEAEATVQEPDSDTAGAAFSGGGAAPQTTAAAAKVSADGGDGALDTEIDGLDGNADIEEMKNSLSDGVIDGVSAEITDDFAQGRSLMDLASDDDATAMTTPAAMLMDAASADAAR